MSFETHEVKGDWCPWCAAYMHQLSGLAGTVPEPGAFSVCIQCTGISQLNESMQLAKFTDVERLPNWFRDEIDRYRAAIAIALLVVPRPQMPFRYQV